jgi:glycosidase
MEADPASLLHFYRHLIALRKQHTALRAGMYAPITYGTRFILAYVRQAADETILVALNMSGRRQRLVLGSSLTGGRWQLLLSSARADAPIIKDGMVTLEPYEALIMLIS